MAMKIGLVALCAIAVDRGRRRQQPTPTPAPPKPPPFSAKLPPPLPEGADPDLEPQVTIIRRETETVEEVRVNGDLRYVKVTPRVGPAYYLVPERQWPDVPALRFARFRAEDPDVAPVLVVN